MSFPLTEQELADARAKAFKTLRDWEACKDEGWNSLPKSVLMARAVIDLGNKLAEADSQLRQEQWRKARFEEALRRTNTTFGDTLKALADGPQGK